MNVQMLAHHQAPRIMYTIDEIFPRFRNDNWMVAIRDTPTYLQDGSGMIIPGEKAVWSESSDSWLAQDKPAKKFKTREDVLEFIRTDGQRLLTIANNTLS